MPRNRSRGRAAKRRRRLRVAWLGPVLVIGVAVFLYYRPLATYVETRGDLTVREAEVERLRARKAQFEQRLERATSLTALGREARRIGLVRPGERLFIVKGIPAWLRSEPDSVGEDE